MVFAKYNIERMYNVWSEKKSPRDFLQTFQLKLNYLGKEVGLLGR